MKLLMLRRHPQLSVVPCSRVSRLHMEYVDVDFIRVSEAWMAPTLCMYFSFRIHSLINS